MPRVCVLRARTNCDVETAHAFELAGAPLNALLFRLLEDPSRLSQFRFSASPAAATAAMTSVPASSFSRQLRGQLNEAMREFLQSDKLVLGICNGFQTILKAGLLMRRGIENSTEKSLEDQVTLTWNANGRYTDRWVRLKVTSCNSVFLKELMSSTCRWLMRKVELS